DNIDVTFDSTGLSIGDYYGNLCVSSDDLTNPLEIVSVELTVDPTIALTKTVGTNPAVCATTDAITVTAGTDVTYCYEVENTSALTLTTHSLVDSELGTLLTDFNFSLAPGASVFLTDTATINTTTVNTATWTAETGGPKYVYSDTISYNFEDISTTGITLTLSDDQVSSALAMGFNFKFYGENYSNVHVSSNGFLTFLSGQDNGCCSGDSIPDAADPNGIVAGWWEDLDPPEGSGEIYYELLGSAPNRYFVVQFNDVEHFPSGNAVTFQYKLFEGTNIIEVHYQTAVSDGGTHTAGIEDQSGSEGIEYHHGTSGLTTPLAVRYVPQFHAEASDTDSATVFVEVPTIAVDPTAIISTQAPDSVVTTTLTISNTGGGSLDWSIFEAPPLIAPPSVQPPAGPAAAEPVVTSAAQCSLYENYPGAEPQGYAEFCLDVELSASGAASFAEGPTDTGFAQDIGFVSDNFVSFTLNDFPGQTVLGSNTQAIFGYDFDASATTLYALDNGAQELGTINLANGGYTAIGPSVPLAGHTWTGLTSDPTTGTFYASSTDGTTSALYTVNTATGAPNLVGTDTNAPLLIDISVGPNGVMYGHDIGTDSIYTIDKSNGVTTLVGLTGYNANFAQGMDFDND
ncbi:MAG: hypothetical protein R3330_09360, partial [Saprospiraceae bacterium]|nr:hypothetical protein [Saprospiraceae bacterium]